MPVPLLRRVIRHRHSAVDEERGGRVVARHILKIRLFPNGQNSMPIVGSNL